MIYPEKIGFWFGNLKFGPLNRSRFIAHLPLYTNELSVDCSIFYAMSDRFGLQICMVIIQKTLMVPFSVMDEIQTKGAEIPTTIHHAVNGLFA